MSLLLHIIVSYIKENTITKLQKLYSQPRNHSAGNKSPTLFVKKPLCKGDLLPVHEIFIERPEYIKTGLHATVTSLVNCSFVFMVADRHE